MAEFPKFDDAFKQNVSEAYHKVKEKVSDTILKEDGSLDTEKIGGAVTDTARKVEDSVRDGCQKFSEEFIKDGTLDKEKLGAAAMRSYRQAGRALATGVSRLSEFLTGKFGTYSQSSEIVDSQIVTADTEDFETEA